jgi:hypothetical protein
MACDISLGRIEQCKDSLGGLRAVYFSNYRSNLDIQYTSGAGNEDVISELGGGTLTAYKYELKGTSTFEQTVTSSRENGSTFVEQKLTLNLKKLTIQDHKQLRLLAYGRPHIFVEDRNGNIFVAGLMKGMDLVSSNITTGAAMGDMSGYSLEFQGMEFKPANFIENGDLGGALVTIVTG